MLADDIGIIDHGVLLEEESLQELENKNTKYIHMVVSDARAAEPIIKRFISGEKYKIIDAYNIQIYDMNFSMGKLNREIVESGFDVAEIHKCENTLEDYFKEVTGGEGIA